MVVKLTAEPRDIATKSHLRNLRSQGKVPCVIYGHNVASRPIAIDVKDLTKLLDTNSHSIIEIDIPQIGLHPVIVQEVQRDKISRELLHIDLRQINMAETVDTTIRLEVLGESVGVQEGGILQLMMHELDIRCLPGVIPDSLKVNVAALALGDHILVKDLHIPAGLEVLSDPDEMVLTILVPQKELPDEAKEIPAEKVL